MSILLLMRHGQASFEADEYDCLSPLGQNQGRATGEFLRARGLQIDHVLTGPRCRHKDTAIAVSAAGAFGASIELVRNLDEFGERSAIFQCAHAQTPSLRQDWPENRPDQLRLYVNEIRRWAEDGAEIPGCKSADAFVRSTKDWLGTLSVRYGRGRRILAVTSAGIIAAALCGVLDLPVKRIGEFLPRIYNASITEFDFGEKGIAIRSFNGTGHLIGCLLSLV